MIAPSEPPSVLVEPKKRGGSVFVQNKRRRPSLPLTTGVAQLFAPAPPLPSSQSQPHPPTLPSPPLLLRRRTPRPGAEPLGRDVHGVVQPACHQGTLVGGPGRCTEMGGLRLWGGLLGLLSDGMSGTPPPLPQLGKGTGMRHSLGGMPKKNAGNRPSRCVLGPPNPSVKAIYSSAEGRSRAAARRTLGQGRRKGRMQIRIRASSPPCINTGSWCNRALGGNALEKVAKKANLRDWVKGEGIVAPEWRRSDPRNPVRGLS